MGLHSTCSLDVLPDASLEMSPGFTNITNRGYCPICLLLIPARWQVGCGRCALWLFYSWRLSWSTSQQMLLRFHLMRTVTVFWPIRSLAKPIRLLLFMENFCTLWMQLLILGSGKKYLRRRVLYYSNSSASFNTELLRAGDIESNPGNVRNPCSVCNKTIARTHRALR